MSKHDDMEVTALVCTPHYLNSPYPGQALEPKTPDKILPRYNGVAYKGEEIPVHPPGELEPCYVIDEAPAYHQFLQGCILMTRKGQTKEDARFRVVFAIKAARIGAEISLPPVSETVTINTYGSDSVTDYIGMMRRLVGL